MLAKRKELLEPCFVELPKPANAVTGGCGRVPRATDPAASVGAPDGEEVRPRTEHALNFRRKPARKVVANSWERIEGTSRSMTQQYVNLK
mmetsp:Transcript_99040/g.275728  ORF Transcript_99040/g.275728 Transcript_99040/m.275728 type:complete len:90 (-) Transcript_99040:377-646(-)